MTLVRLKIERGLREVDLSDLFPGVTLTIDRLDSGQIAAAHDRAQKAVKSLRDGIDALGTYGLARADASGARVNLADPDQMFRIGSLIGAVEVAFIGIKSWNITLDSEGTEPAPINRESLAAFLMDDAVQARVLAEIQRAARILVAEGKDFGALQNGCSTDGQTAEAPNSATTAVNVETDAPKDSVAATDTSAQP